jgi:peptide/nickel transport system substrate-binding protein
MKRLLWLAAAALLAPAAELRFALHDEPKTLDPMMTSDESEETLRYLTEGVLIRINRLTQLPEGELATSWKIAKDSKSIVFQLRQSVTFPDGSPFTSTDVVQTFQRLLDPALHAPIADSFKTDKGVVQVSAKAKYTVVAEFPAPTGGIERMFDQVAIVSAKAHQRPAPGLGPFLISGRTPGGGIVVKRNPAYWKHDAGKIPLPRIDSIRLDIEQNRDLELLRFRRGEVQLIDKLTPDLYERLAAEVPGAAVDAGPTLESEFLWFNQAPQAPLPESKKVWFRSTAFRRAISKAIQRADLCRVVYRGHAIPAAGPVSPANKLWFKDGLLPEPFDPAASLKLLESDGFRMQAGSLRDKQGNAVEFSVITNGGNKARERMAAMIQQDLKTVGVRVNIVTLDLPSLIERMTRTLNYEACLLGLMNIDPDPSELMNVLLSSASNHPWNPSEKTPATPWEAEIDRLMLAQAATADFKLRKKEFDRVQEILAAQSPIVYLLHPNALSAVSPQLSGVKATAFFPHTFWDIEHIAINAKSGRAKAAGR